MRTVLAICLILSVLSAVSCKSANRSSTSPLPSSSTTSATSGPPTRTTTAATTTTPQTTASGNSLSLPALKYALIDRYGQPFFCDPDFYPVARPGQEQQNAIDQFPSIRANAPEFSAILARLSLPDQPDYTNDDKLNIYRQHKLLAGAITLEPAGNAYTYSLRIGQGQGFRINGTISASGAVQETSRETSFNTCPICLAKGTLISTPDGDVPVEQVTAGMAVWTQDLAGNRVESRVLATSNTPVPQGFLILRITLSDGRSLTASAGHPTASGRPLGDYMVGDGLDGSIVASIVAVDYPETSTWDLLPAGPTGFYWANGILVGSTLKLP